MRHHQVRWAVLVVAMMVLAGCGNRLSRTKILSENAVKADSTASASAPGDGSAPAGSGQASGTSDQPAALATGGATSAKAGAAAAGTASGTQNSSGVTTKVTAQGGSSAGGGTTGATTARAVAAASANNAPLVFGLINNETGIGANVTLPVREAWQAWAKSVNASGGIKGHPVQIEVADCANNTSLNVPSARDLVEKRGAIALGFECSELTGIPEYAASKHIPVIGSLVGAPAWNTNPMLFPNTANSEGGAKGMAVATKELGVQKVAVLYCVESPTCKNGSDAYVSAAKAAGLDVVYYAGTTVTQPDYTSECLQARNAGATGLYVGGLPDQSVKVARSCWRQQYKPQFIMAPTADSQLAVPELDGMASFAGNFPYFLHSGSPALDEYGQALTKYAPKLLTDGSSLQTSGWVSGKLLQKAAELGLSPDRAPTTQDILNGLWSIKSETLGGLFAGGMARTFTRDQPTADSSCTYIIVRKGDHYTAPHGTDPTCG